jgi:hypothetical protein
MELNIHIFRSEKQQLKIKAQHFIIFCFFVYNILIYKKKKKLVLFFRVCFFVQYSQCKQKKKRAENEIPKSHIICNAREREEKRISQSLFNIYSSYFFLSH